MARVKVPTLTQKDIVEALLRRKKQELLEMYVIDADDLDQLEKQAKQPAPALAVAGPALVAAAAGIQDTSRKVFLCSRSDV